MARFLLCFATIGAIAVPSTSQAQNLIETLVVASHDADDFNIALVDSVCGETVPAEVTITLTNQSSPAVPIPDDKFYAWWVQSESTECSNVPDEAADQEHSESVDLALVAKLITTTRYPDDFNGAPDLTTHSILAEFGACETDGVSERRKLCFGVDAQFGTDTGITIDQTEWVSSMVFEVDTIAPGNGIIHSVTPADGKVLVSVGLVDSGESDDIESIGVRSRAVPAEDDGLTDCDDWPDAKEDELSATVSDLGTNTQSIELPGENGVEIEFCIWGIDDVGNVGAASDVAMGEPRDECDFIECYPGNPPHGYCGATGCTPIWLSLIPLGLLIRRRRSS